MGTGFTMLNDLTVIQASQVSLSACVDISHVKSVRYCNQYDTSSKVYIVLGSTVKCFLNCAPLTRLKILRLRGYPIDGLPQIIAVCNLGGGANVLWVRSNRWYQIGTMCHIFSRTSFLTSKIVWRES